MNTTSTTKRRAPIRRISGDLHRRIRALAQRRRVRRLRYRARSTTPATRIPSRISNLPQLGVEGVAPANSQGVLPVEIKIPSVGIDLPVQNPATTDVDALDALLNKGPARYVNSAELGVSGNVLIFAHSSHLPIVTNKMFQAFNQIPNLNPGDSIELDGADGKAYLYSVDSVVKPIPTTVRPSTSTRRRARSSLSSRATRSRAPARASSLRRTSSALFPNNL